MTDEFGLSDGLLGPLPSWFFPAVGRVVAVSSLLEQRTQVLAETLAALPQDSLTMTRLSGMRTLALKAAREIDRANDPQGIEPIVNEVHTYFAEVVKLMDRRNGIVHAVWPAQGGEAQFGWRPRRLGRDAQTRGTSDNTRAQMVDLIRSATARVESWPSLFMRANHARSRAAEVGYAGLLIEPARNTAEL